MQVLRNRAAFPRAWVVHDARLIRPLDDSSPATREALIARLRFAEVSTRSGPPRSPADLRAWAYVETDEPAALAPYLAGAGVDTTETVTVRYDGPTRVVLEASLHRPGIIVLADLFDPGWRLVLDGSPAPILRANLLMRAAAVTAGTHTLVYTYEPASIRLGAGGTAIGLIALIGLALWAHARPLVRSVLHGSYPWRG